MAENSTDMPPTEREYKRVRKLREAWDTTLDKNGKYLLPGSAGLATTTDIYTARGEGRGAEVFDTTGAEALEERAAILHGKIFPPLQDWMDCEHRVPADLPAKAKEEVEQHARDSAKKFMRAIRNSNFDMELPQSLSEALISTSAIILHMNKRGSRSPFRFEVVPLRDLFVEEGLSGRLTRVFVRRRVRVSDIEKKWPDAKLNDAIRQMLKEDPNKEIELIDCFLPSGDDDRGCKYEVWFFDKRHCLVKRDYEVSPVIAYRFAKDAGENMGRGPGLKAGPAVYTINAAKELVLEDAALQIEGIWNLYASGGETYDVQEIRPGIVVQTSQPNGGLSRVDMGGRVDIADYIIKDGQNSARQAIMGTDLPPAEDGVRTAYEWAVRTQRNADVEIPTTLRLIVELVLILGQRGLHILQSLEWRGDPVYGIEPLTIEGQEDVISLMPSMRNPISKLYDQAEAARLITAVAEAVQIFGPERVAGALQMNNVLRKILKLRDVPVEAMREEDFTIELDKAERQQIVNALTNLAQGAAGAPPGAPGMAGAAA